MIQKFIGSPITDYDVIIISDGTKDQIDAKLSEIKDLSNNPLPRNSHFVYITDFGSLCKHLADTSYWKSYPGRVYFMFFNSFDYIQEFIWDVLETCGRSMVYPTKTCPMQLKNTYLYFGLIQDLQLLDPFTLSFTTQKHQNFSFMVSIVSAVLNKMGSILAGVKAVYINDSQWDGERSTLLRELIRNYPKVEKFKLASLH